MPWPPRPSELVLGGRALRHDRGDVGLDDRAVLGVVPVGEVTVEVVEVRDHAEVVAARVDPGVVPHLVGAQGRDQAWQPAQLRRHAFFLLVGRFRRPVEQHHMTEHRHPQASICSGSASIAPTSLSTMEPRSPSTMRWSKDSASVVTLRTASWLSCTQGMSRIWPSARMAASPGGRIGVPVSTPNTPTLVIEIVPSRRSAWDALPARAVWASSPSAAASSGSDSAWASLMLGTTSPRPVAAAMPRLT